MTYIPMLFIYLIFAAIMFVPLLGAWFAVRRMRDTWRSLILVVVTTVLLTPSLGPATIVVVPVPFGLLFLVTLMRWSWSELAEWIIMFPLSVQQALHISQERKSLKTPDEFAEAMNGKGARSSGGNGFQAALGAGRKRYSPCPQTRLLNAMVLLVCGGGSLWVAWRALGNHHPLLAGLFALGTVVAVTGVAYVTTVNVVIDESTLVRTWLVGRRVVVLEDIAQLGLVRYKGTVSLLVRKSRWRQLSLSSDTFDWQDVRCMHRDILLALGLDSEPMWPTAPRWLGMLDVAAVMRYRRFQAETQGSDGGPALH